MFQKSIHKLLKGSLFVLSCICFTALPVRGHDLIPKPESVTFMPGKAFLLKEGMTLSYDAESEPLARYLAETLGKSTGFNFHMKEGGRKGLVLRTDSEKSTRPEGYELKVTSSRIEITGHDPAGTFYGIQTLLQLLPEAVYSRELQRGVSWEVPQVQISDAPERPWRGMMLDVARYFFDKEFVKKYIDMMAMYKLNKLQFHLIDDSGWRLEIKKYPRLTEMGAWAKTGTHPMGGYYTQEDMREIIAYAQLRGVEVIPEIEFPAHMLSAVVAYPWLSCTGIQHQLPLQHFISRDLLCLGKESSYRFLSDVLDEVCALFPSPYVNIGGDEAVYTEWEKCPECQRVRKEQGLEKTSDLQGYLTNVVADMMAAKGKTVTGWEEILLRGDVSQPLVGMFWHHASDTVKIAGTPHKAVLIPSSHFYFDFPESSTPGEVKGATWLPPVSLEKVYSLDVPDYSPSSCVLGVEACFWSDQFIHGTLLQEIPYLNENRSENYAEYFSFPRLLALSEVAWCKSAGRDFSDFRSRMKTHYRRLDGKGCNYRVPEPIVTRLEEDEKGYTFELETPVAGASIHYTLDGSYPTFRSPEYAEAVTVADKNDFKAITVVSPRHFSLPLYYEPDYSGYEAFGKYVASWKPEDISSDGSAWRFDCSGKITGNGSYRLAFVPLKDSASFHVKEVRLYKRGELLAAAAADQMVEEDGALVFPLTVELFEAGTPLYIEAFLSADETADLSGHVFVRQN